MTTSSYCVAGDCLVVEYTGASVVVQDTKLLGVDGGPVQVWLPVEWNDLLRTARHYTTSTQYVRWDPTAEEFPFTFGLSRHDKIELTGQEWLDFVNGVRGGQFEIDKLSSPAPGGPVAGRTAATGAVEPGPAPAPVVAGMNAAGYAAMNVPAGRDQPDESTPVGSLDAVATTGQPGPEISDEAVEAAAIRLKVNAECHGAFTTLHTMRQWARDALTAAMPLLGTPAPAWGSGPLVKFDLPDTSHAAVDMGWASPDGLVNEAGEVGPGPAEHPSSGPTEPADCEQARA